MIDLVFMIEGSSSLNQWGENNFGKITNATKMAVNYFNASESRIGVVLYATDAELKVNFSFTLNQRLEALDSLSFPSGWTLIGRGLNYTREQLFSVSRENAHRVLVVYTDGTSNDAVSVAAELLRDMNVTILMVALEDWYDEGQVNTIATDPDLKTVLKVEFSDLEELSQRVQEIICEGG